MKPKIRAPTSWILLFLLSLALGGEALASTYDDFADQTYRKFENSITFQLTPSTYPLDWETPRGLVFSLVKNRYYFPKTHSTLGHVTSEINCTIVGQRRHILLGAGPKDLMGFKATILHGFGFSLLNRPGEFSEIPLVTIDGRLDAEFSDMNEYSQLIRVDNFGALTVLVEPQACAAALSFAEDFIKKTAETPTAGNRYGFGADPNKFEGAGCAPLAESVMTHAGLFSLARKMERTLYVPANLLGDPEKGRQVSIWTLLSGEGDMTKPSEGALKFVFPDPQLLYDHLLNVKQDSAGFIERKSFPESKSILVIQRLNE